MSQEQVESLAAFVLTAAQKLLVGEQKLLKTAAAINRGLCYIARPPIINFVLNIELVPELFAKNVSMTTCHI